MKALALLSALQSADIVLPTTDGREIRLRRVTEPDARQKSLLRQLGITLPDHFQLNRKCRADSATVVVVTPLEFETAFGAPRRAERKPGTLMPATIRN